MEKYPPYVTRSSGDAVTSDDWNRLQELIREEIRQHGHGGEIADSNRLGPLGATLGNDSLAEGAVVESALASGAVTTRVLQEQFMADASVAADAAILEKDNLLFHAQDGHDHDGVNSSPLASNSVGTLQLADFAVTDDKLAGVLRNEIIELEQILAIPQVLSVGSAPGSTEAADSFVDIVGHAFGNTPGEVRLLKVLPGAPGEYQAVETLEIEEWTANRIRVRLPEDPTGLFQVVINGLPLNAVEFKEVLIVAHTSPVEGTLTVSEGILIEIEFSTELLIDPATMEDPDGPTPLVLWPGESTPRPLVQEAREQPPFQDLPIEVFHGDDVLRMDGELTLSRDRKVVTFSTGGRMFPFNTPVLVKVYGAHDRGRKPVFLADNTRAPMDSGTFELRFRVRKQPPRPPRGITIRGVRGKDNEVVTPENMISVANERAVPIEIKLHEGALPSEWVLVQLTDGVTEISEKVPALGDENDLIYVSLDASSLRDGQVRIMAQAQNTTSSSPWTEIASIDPRRGVPVDWVLKDTKIPYVVVHPVRTPTRLDTQRIAVDVEPGSSVTVQGGARPVVVVDSSYEGRISVDVPLNPNTSNRLRVSAVDPAGNRSRERTADRTGTPLIIVHDDTIPELRVDPVRTPTNRRQVVITGRANEPVTVVATAGGVIAMDTADANKGFHLPFTLSPNATTEIRVVATDRTGNTTPPVILRITHDDRPPPLVLEPDHGYSLSRGDSSRPRITTRQTRISLRGRTEPGATLTLTGEGTRTTATAGANGVFTIPLPERLMPTNRYLRHELRTWSFTLDAVDPSGNHSNQQKNITVRLRYRIPDEIRLPRYRRTVIVPQVILPPVPQSRPSRIRGGSRAHFDFGGWLRML